MPESVHQFDPDSRPDSDYEPGSPAHLVPGNRGRLLDPRRTPVRVIALDPSTGHFTVEIEAFEDRGARWDVPFEDCARHYQFERGSTTAPSDAAAAIEARARDLDRTLEISCDTDRLSATRDELARLRADAGTWLDRHSSWFRSGAALNTASRRGPEALWADLRSYLTARDLWDLEDAFTSGFVSNPHSGERVKGHRIVLAELGLVAYRDKVVRDPALFDGAWSRARRAGHLLHRLAFVHETLRRAGLASVTLYRGLAFDGPLEPMRNRSFVSSSFDVEVAMSCYAPPQVTSSGILMRQVVPIERVFMTYLETEAMNRQFHEAEAVLLHEDGNPLF